MLTWELVKPEFAWEGSLRDVCVQDVDVASWRIAIAALVDQGFESRFTVGGVVVERPDDVGLLFEGDRDELVCWSLWTEGVLLNCHFFDPGEIEFDLDPREVTGQSQFDALVRVMSLLASSTGRPALMTPENMHDAPIVRVEPSGETRYVSSDGFFEKAARNR